MNRKFFNLIRNCWLVITFLLAYAHANGQCPTTTLTKVHTDVTCNSANDGTITVELGNGNAPLNFELYDLNTGTIVTLSVTEINDPDGNGNFRKVKYTNVYPSSFQVLVFKAGCPTLQVTETAFGFVVQEPTAVTFTTSQVDVLGCHGDNTGSITVSASGGTPGYTYSKDNGATFQASNVFSSLAAGTYQIIVKDANNCVTTATPVTITEPTVVTFITSQVNITVCHGNNTGSITIAASGGTPGYTYSDDNGATFQASNVFNSLVAGTYQIIVKDANNCVTAATPVTITEPPAVTFTTSQVNITGCHGDATGSITITASGGTPGYTYSKDNGATFQAGNIFNSLTAGTYQIVVKDANNCVTTATPVTVTEPPVVTFTTASTNATCNGANNGSITITASGGTPGYTYSDDNGATFQASNVFGSLAPGTYQIIVKDANNCVTAATPVTITQPPVVTFTTTSTNATCNGANNGSITVTASGGTPGYTYSKDNGATFQASNVFGSLAPATYQIIVKDANNCVTVATPVTITQPSAVTFTTASTNVNCNGGNNGSITITASGGTAGYTYSDDNGATFQAGNIFNSLTAGTYQIVVKDANNCVTVATPVTITEPPAVTFTTAQVNVLGCHGDNTGSITVTASGGTPGYTYSKDNGATFQAGNIFNSLTAGTYQIVVKDANNCATTATPVTITEPPVVTFTTTSTNATCNGANNGSITVTASGGTPGYTYSKDNGATFQASNVFGSLAPATYQIIVKDANNCMTAATPVTINQPTAVTFTTSQVNVLGCHGDNTGSITITASGGTAGYTYSDDNGATFQAGNIFNSLTAGTYQIVVKDANNCVTTATPVTITEPPVIAFTTASTNANCNGANNGSITVTASGGTPGYTYSDDNGATFQASNVFGSLAPGTYQIVVKDASNCVTTATPVTITEPAAVTFTTALANATCNGANDGSITITASGGTPTYTYSDDNGATFQASNNFGSLAPATYQIIVKDANNCVTPATPVTITEPAGVSFTTASTNISCNGANDGSITITASGGTPGYTYSDDNGATFQASNTFGSLIPGTYQIIVKDASNCATTATPVTITEPAVISFTNASTNVSCNGANDGTITVTASGGTPTYTYSDDNGATFQASNVFGSLAPGTYQIIVKDANNCVTSATPVTITEPAALAFTPTPTDASCNGASDGSISIAASGGTPSYMYSNDNGTTFQASNVFPGLPANNYLVVVKDNNGCTTSATVSISEPAVVAFTTTQVDVIGCNGDATGSITVTPSGGTPGYTFSDDNGVTFQASPVFPNLIAGNYNVVVQDSKTCLSAASVVTISEPLKVTFTTTKNDVTCIGNTDGSIVVSASGGTGAYTYSKDNGTTFQVSNVFNVLAVGSYNIVVKDANNCISSPATITISQPLPASATLSGSTSICVGDVTNLSINLTGAGPWNVVYFDGSSNASLSNVTTNPLLIPVNPTFTTTYTLVSVSDACSAGTVSGSATITVNPIGGNPAVYGLDTWIAYVYNDVASPAPPVTNITYSNAKYRGFISETEIAALGTSSYNFPVDTFDLNLGMTTPVTGANLCGSYLDDYSIRFRMQKNFTAGVYTFTVSSDDGSRLLIDGVNVIDPTAFNSHAYQTYTATVCLTAGLHKLDLEYFERGGISRVTFAYKKAPAPTVTPQPLSLCVNAPTPTFTATSSDAAVTGFNWYSDAALTTQIATGATFTPTSAQLDMTAAGTTNFFVVSTYACGQSDPGTVQVDIFNNAAITVPSTAQQVCGSGGTVDLGTFVSAVPTGGTFTFSGTGVTTSPTFDPTLVTTGSTTITVDYAVGTCTAPTETFDINVINTVTVTVPASPVAVCQGAGLQDLTVLVSATPAGGTFTFSSTTAGAVTGTKFDPSVATGVVTIKVDYAIGGCSGSKTFDYNITPNASFSTSNQTVCPASGLVNLLSLVSSVTPTGGSFSFSGTGVSGSSLDPSVSAGTTVPVAVTYSVGGCTPATGTINVTVRTATDPACSSAANCLAFAASDPVIEVRPTCSGQNDGKLTFGVKGGSGSYIVTLYDSVSTPVFTQAKVGSSATPITFTSLSPSLTYFYKIDDGTNICVLPYSLPINTTVKATASDFTNVSCYGDSTGTAKLTITGGNSPYEYSLDGVTWTAGLVSGNTVSGLPPNGTYNILVRDDASDLCPAETPVTINNANPNLTVTYSSTDATCNGADGSIKVNPPAAPNIGGGGPYTYALYNGVTTSAFQNGVDFNNLSGGTYSILVKDATGCTKTIKNVTVNFPGIVNYDPNPIVTPPDCAANGKNGVIAFKILDAGSFTIALSQDPSTEPADSLFKKYVSPSAIFTNLSNGIYYVYIRSSSSECATRSMAIPINGVNAVSFSTEPDCNDNKVSLVLTNIVGENGTPFELTVTQKIHGVDSVIVDHKPFQRDPLSLTYFLDADDYLFLQTPGEYKLTLDQNQTAGFCTVYSDPVTYDVYSPLFAALESKQIPPSPAPSFPDMSTGSFKVINIMGGLPDYTIDVQLDSAASDIGYIPTSNIVTRNTNSQFEAVYKNVPGGRYKIDVTDKNGCVVELFARIRLDMSIIIPNIFTPNEDGYNDTFTIRNLPEGTKMVVTNRWGKEVFASKDYQNDWDGNGVSDGVYFYRLEVPAGSPLTGWVEIVRGEKP